ncbi:histidine kinase [Roseateles chitinivorans]|uniref:sensor histidine kinase n=1 Tax=Roseateles chitinivorans TaxID=2917965 RepID=UPI003D66DB47
MNRDRPRFGWRLSQAWTRLMQAVAVVVAASLHCAGAWALPADYSVAELYQTRWTVREGVPTGIAAMVQTPDGFLWLGSPGGLFRFDGVAFERFTGAGGVPLLSQDIYALNVTADGALWIGHHLGGVSRLHQGRLVNYGPEQGLPRASLTALAEDGDGVPWAGTTRGLYRLDHGRWTAVNTAWNVPADPVDAMVLDRDRTLWVMGNDHVYQLRHGVSRFEQSPVTIRGSNFSNLVLHPDGAAMVCQAARVQALTPPLTPSAMQGVPAWVDRPVDLGDNRCGFDRSGQLWFGGPKGGGRFPPAPRPVGTAPSGTRLEQPEPVSLPAGLTSRVLEDLEGNLWFATRSGLERIRTPALRKLPFEPAAMEFALAPAGDRGVWIGASTGRIARAHPGIEERIATDPHFDIGIDVVYTDPAGTLWIAAGDSIWQRRPDGRWRRSVRGAAAVATGGYAYSSIEAMTQDMHGAMWVSVLRVGVYRVIGDQWTLWGGRTDMPRHNVTALFTDPAGRVWFGYDDGLVQVLDGDRFTTAVAAGPAASAASGASTASSASSAPAPRVPALGEVSVFEQQGRTLWIGSQKGLWRLEESGALHAVEGLQGAFTGVTGIVPTAAGDLWLSTVEGAVRLGADALREARAEPGRRVRHELLDHLDGLPGVPDAAVGNNGRIWFATVDGVVWIDPSRRPRNTVAPTVVLKSVLADGAVYPFSPEAPTRLPLRTRDLKITFTATSLTMPERVRFRYRLVDADAQPDAADTGSAASAASAGWQDIGNHREVYFRDLAPGRYRFEVGASNNDGLWSDAGAGVEVVIPPAFVQTPWFLVLCVMVALALLWWLSVMRLRAVNDRLRLRLEERMVERERIARELHDTFLQAVQGLMLRFHSAMEVIPAHEPARRLMEQALDSADEVTALGRDAVLNLREPADESIDLAADLHLIGERWSLDTGIAFVAEVQGEARALDPIVLQECQRLATEALNNAFRHAEAATVRLDIVHASRAFTLQVSDDGRGFDTAHRHSGRWGLVGMRERAARLRATLEIRSGTRGTTVRLRVPARLAYRRPRRSWLQRLTGAASRSQAQAQARSTGRSLRAPR